MSATFVPTPDIAAAQQVQLAALLEGAAIVPLDDIGWLRVTGDDRVRWLNGMTTNSIQELAPGQGNYNFFLSAQGRIQADAYAFAESGNILLHTARARIPALVSLLDRFIIMDDVELADISGDRFGLLCAGPTSAELLTLIGIDAGAEAPLHLTTTTWEGELLTVLHAYSPLVPRFEVWAGNAEIVARFSKALTAAGATLCGPTALDHLRILEGTPLYGTDIRDRELPQETGQTRALHFAKGCYLGQEIVERIRSRGNVHRSFHAFELTGDFPTSGAILESGGKAVGELTSVATIPLSAGSIQLGLGYIRREALERAEANNTISYSGGHAIPVATPFRI